MIISYIYLYDRLQNTNNTPFNCQWIVYIVYSQDMTHLVVDISLAFLWCLQCISVPSVNLFVCSDVFVSSGSEMDNVSSIIISNGWTFSSILSSKYTCMVNIFWQKKKKKTVNSFVFLCLSNKKAVYIVFYTISLFIKCLIGIDSHNM